MKVARGAEIALYFFEVFEGCFLFKNSVEF